MTNNLKMYRKLRHFTQSELASWCNVSRNTISSIERNEFMPSLDLAFRLGDVLCCPVHLIFDFSDDYSIFNEFITFNG